MKNKAENKNTAGDLPDFLQDIDASASGSEELLAESDEAFDDEGDYEEEGDEVYSEHDEHELEHEVPEARPAHAQPSARRSTAAPAAPSSGGGLAMTFGGLSILAGLGLGVAQSSGATSVLAAYGLQPATLLVLGAVMLGVAFVRRQVGHLESRLGDGGSADTQALRADVQQLVEAQRAHEERAPAAGEELQHVLLLLQRQDEKVNNLTKAIKMYGKPLMEIAGQGTDLAGTLGQLRTAFDGSDKEVRAAVARVEAAIADTASPNEGIDQLKHGIAKVAAAIDQVAKSKGKDISIEPLQQQTARIEVGIQALAQRLEDTEVRRSLVRLEDAAKKAHEEMQQLLRGENVNAVASQLQKALDTASTRLLEGIGQLREGNIGGLESSVKEIQREVAGVATVVHQIQTAVRSGARAPAAPSAPAPAAPAPVAALSTAAAAPAAAAPAPKATPAAGAAKSGDSAGGYQTGARSSSGKNVLGAIAKLKQMKS